MFYTFGPGPPDMGGSGIKSAYAIRKFVWKSVLPHIPSWYIINITASANTNRAEVTDGTRIQARELIELQ